MTTTQATLAAHASQASVSMINNQGNLGAVLSELGSSQNMRSLVTAIVLNGNRSYEDILANGMAPGTIELSGLMGGLGVALTGGDAQQIGIGGNAATNAAEKTMMNQHPIKFEFVETENLLASYAQQVVVIADDKKTDRNEFLVDLIQKILPEYRFPATNWGAFTDYLCDLDEESRPNTVIAHFNLPRFNDPQQIEHYIKCLGEALLRWRSSNPKTDRLIVRFLKQDEDYVVNVMNEDWKKISSSPYFDSDRYRI